MDSKHSNPTFQEFIFKILIPQNFYLVVCVLLISIVEDGFSQSWHFNYNYDSIANQLPHLENDKEKIESLLLLIDRNPDISSDPTEEQHNYLEQLIELSRKNQTINIEPYVRMHEAFVKWGEGDFENSFIILNESVSLFDEQKKNIAPLLLQMRTLFNLMNNQDKRFQFYKEKLNYYLINGPIENTASCYHGIAGYYNYQADYNLAISNYLRAASIFETFWQSLYNNEMAVVGHMYELWGNDEKAVHYLNIALPLIRESTDTSNIAFSLITLTTISTKQKKYELALSYADESINATSNLKNVNSPIYAITLLSKAFVYLAMQEPNLAYPYIEIAQGLIDKFDFQFTSNEGDLQSDFGFYSYYMLINDQQSAIKYLQIAYNKALTEKANIFQLKYLKELASFYEKRNPELSLGYFKSYFELQKTIEKDHQKFKIAQYEIEQKELEQTQSINLLKQEKILQEAAISQRNAIIWISLVALLLIIVSMIFLYRQFKLNRKTLLSLRKTQRQLIHTEKMASLGELTAGIAHEIQNPLNFVNNFSEVSVDLVDELSEEIDSDKQDEVKAIAKDLKQNLQKISNHGKRASFIVKGMLEHSRTSTGELKPVDINLLAEEFFKLSYHGLRAKDKSFNAEMITDFDKDLPRINVVGQDIGRVILNLINNAFYSVAEKQKQKQKQKVAAYNPTVTVKTIRKDGVLEIRVKDNGNGISADMKEKIFQPFFTTKPTGSGTGLGLSLSHDIITKGHGGTLTFKSEKGEGSEFIIELPII